MTKKLFTAEGVFDSVKDHEDYLWGQSILRERQRQIDKGYDDAHDATHGPDHLILWAIEYIREGKQVEAAAILYSLRKVIADSRGSLMGWFEEYADKIPSPARQKLRDALDHADPDSELW